MINYYLIRSVEMVHYNKSVESFYKTTPVGTELNIIDELDTREETINKIFSLNNKNDLVFFADDIVLTEGWHEIILNNLNRTKSIGFSMLNPTNTGTINFGYDLIEENGEVKTLARRGPRFAQLNPATLSDCVTFTGCFMAIAAGCFKLLPQVPLEGRNRLGELIYHILLRRLGGTVLVSGHTLYHYSVSTKSSVSNDIRYSQSYQDEKNIWDEADKKFNLKSAVNMPTSTDHILVPENLPMGIVIWGAGSIAQQILSNVDIDVSSIVSGLREEDQRSFLGLKIQYYETLSEKKIPNILITVEGMEDVISKTIRAYFDVENIYYTKVIRSSGRRDIIIAKVL